MSDALEFIDESLLYESTWERAEEHERRFGPALTYYGASVGSVRGTVRDARRRYRELTHDDVTSLASALWSQPVFERRLAAIVLLQASLPMLLVTDLTRMEGFLRTALIQDLVDPLAIDVVGPLLLQLSAQDAARAVGVVERWAADDDSWLRRAAVLAHLPAYRTGVGDDAAFGRTVRRAMGAPRESLSWSDAAVRRALGDDVVPDLGEVARIEDAVERVRAAGAP